jgi:glycosyltransferase involved in cell wall biosynthesis
MVARATSSRREEAPKKERNAPKPTGVCIIVENQPVPADTRVWREAMTLTEAGYSVSVICPKGPGFEQSHETLHGVEIYRHRVWQGSGPLGYVVEYGWALAAEFLLALRVYAATRFRILQACNPPDTIFLIAMFFKVLGVRFIFDQHDPFPEFFEARFQRGGFFYRLIRLAERMTFRTADVTIVTNDSCREIAITRGGVSPERCFVVRTCPGRNDFPWQGAHTELKQGRKYLVVYVGVMGSQDGINLLLESIDYLIKERGRSDTLFVLIGGGPELHRLRARATALHLNEWVKFTGALYGEELRAYLATADLGVSPDPLNVFNDKLTMIKILEYMACGLPIVLYDLVEGHRSASDAALYAKPNDPIDFAEQITTLLDSESSRRLLGAIGRKRIQGSLNWETESQMYLQAYETGLHLRTRRL